VTRGATVTIVFVGLCLLQCSSLHAQFARLPEPGRFELSAGPSWTGAVSYDSRDATLTTGNGDRFRLFSASSSLSAVTGIDVRFGARVTRFVHAEVLGTYGAPRLKTTIRGDVEGAAAVTASEPIKQFTLEGTGIVVLSRWRFGSRALPFVGAGAGYVRQLHDANVLVQTGRTYNVGGGIKFSLATRAGSRRGLQQIGLRVDGRACIRTGGVTLDGRAHTVPQFGASLFVGF
jgi:opacity protein-like surface antigen